MIKRLMDGLKNRLYIVKERTCELEYGFERKCSIG